MTLTGAPAAEAAAAAAMDASSSSSNFKFKTKILTHHFQNNIVAKQMKMEWCDLHH